MINTPRENNPQNRSHATAGAFGGALLGIFGGVLADMLIGPLFGLVGGENGVLGAFSRIVGGIVSGAIAGRRQRAIVSGIIVAFIVALIVRQFGEMIGEAAIGGVIGRTTIWALIGVVVGVSIGLIIREVRVIGYRTKKRFDDIDDPIIIDGKPPQIMNPTPEDIFEKLWVAAAFAPLAVFYTTLLLILRSFFDYLNNFELFKEVNDLVLGFGTPTLVILIIELALKNSHNDFIAGPIFQLNLYTFFFLGLVRGDIPLATILMIVYFVAEIGVIPSIIKEKNISENEWIKYKHLGLSRRSFILNFYFFQPFATIISAIIAYLILGYFFPVDEWISKGVIEQIRFMTLQVVLWTLIYKVLVIKVEGIGVRGDFLISRLFGILIQPLFLPNHIWAWILYLIGIAWAWLDMGLHIWSGNEKAKRLSK